MKETMTYTEAKNQLEEIVNDLQNNQLTVDELSSKIKEAVGLINFCKKRLRSVDSEVDKILKNSEE